MPISYGILPNRPSLSLARSDFRCRSLPQPFGSTHLYELKHSLRSLAHMRPFELLLLLLLPGLGQQAELSSWLQSKQQLWQRRQRQC